MKDNQTAFLKGKKVILRPLDPKTDFELCLKWVNDWEVSQFLGRAMPVYRKQEEEWFDGHAKSKTDLCFAIEVIETGELIGCMGLHEIDWIHRTATTGAMIGDKRYWGKGYGTDAKMALLDYAFNTLNLRKVSSKVVKFNKRSIAYSLKCGYKIEAQLRCEVFKKGRYWDVVILAVFKKDWLPLWRRYHQGP